MRIEYSLWWVLLSILMVCCICLGELLCFICVVVVVRLILVLGSVLK